MYILCCRIVEFLFFFSIRSYFKQIKLMQEPNLKMHLKKENIKTCFKKEEKEEKRRKNKETSSSTTICNFNVSLYLKMQPQ